jgi:hypothetical protein
MMGGTDTNVVVGRSRALVYTFKQLSEIVEHVDTAKRIAELSSHHSHNWGNEESVCQCVEFDLGLQKCDAFAIVFGRPRNILPDLLRNVLVDAVGIEIDESNSQDIGICLFDLNSSFSLLLESSLGACLEEVGLGADDGSVYMEVAIAADNLRSA